MSQSDVTTALHEALSPVVAAEGLYLEQVRLGGSKRAPVVTVVVDLPDGPGGVGSDALGEVSQAVSARMDEVDDIIDGAYELQVTTPGISRPLTEPRHFRRAQGRLVTVTTTEGSVHGRIKTADDEGLVLLSPPERGKPGQRKSGQGEPVVLTWDQVRRGAIEVEFKSATNDH